MKKRNERLLKSAIKMTPMRQKQKIYQQVRMKQVEEELTRLSNAGVEMTGEELKAHLLKFVEQMDRKEGLQ